MKLESLMPRLPALLCRSLRFENRTPRRRPQQVVSSVQAFAQGEETPVVQT